MVAELTRALMANRRTSTRIPTRATARPHLSPRKRVTLDLLLHGHSRAEIADRLKISAHTAGGYVKEVFTHFGVHTHVELIAGFYHGRLKL